MNPKVYVVGASHGLRLAAQLEKIENFKSKYILRSFCIRGKKFRDLPFPQTEKSSEQDILIVIPFGNDLQKSLVKFDKNDRKLHLTTYKPISEKEYDRLCEELYDKVVQFPGKVLIITNFLRYLCCEAHEYKGWVSLQKKFNSTLAAKFQSLKESVKIVDHYSLVDDQVGRKTVKKVKHYRKLQSDSVHFKNYRIIAERIFNQFF